VILLGLRLMVPWKDIRASLGFVLLSALATLVPFLAVSYFNYEFPSIAGGCVGLAVSVLLAKQGIGLHGHDENPKDGTPPVGVGRLVKALFPLWGTVLVLLVTRVPELGLRGWLNATEPHVGVPLGRLGQLFVSVSGVLHLQGIFGTSASWTHALLFVPSFVPFVLVSLLAFVVFRMDFSKRRAVWGESFARIMVSVGAFAGSLVLVKLLMAGGERAPTLVLGDTLARITGAHWQLAAAPLGALGSFVAGSSTIANLTFGGIQKAIAEGLGLDSTTILALQSTGAALGNMICIANIVAVAAVLGLEKAEGTILRLTLPPAAVFAVIAAVVSFAL
jgi:lactate permease